MGTRLQRTISEFLMSFLIGPTLMFVAHLLIRIEVRGEQRLENIRDGAILACRHYYEWDPLLILFKLLWKRLFRYSHLVPINMAGKFWMQNRFFRALSSILSIMAVIRGEGSNQRALRRAATFIGRPGAYPIAFFPTGPIGRATTFQVRPGVAQLALMRPDVPVIPVTFTGIHDLKPGSLFRFRRPRLCIFVGEPFYARDVRGTTDQERTDTICELITESWLEMENGPVAIARAA